MTPMPSCKFLPTTVKIGSRSPCLTSRWILQLKQPIEVTLFQFARQKMKILAASTSSCLETLALGTQSLSYWENQHGEDQLIFLNVSESCTQEFTAKPVVSIFFCILYYHFLVLFSAVVLHIPHTSRAPWLSTSE